MAKNKSKKGTGLWLLALIILINPNVHTFDILPDFIAFFIIASKLSYSAVRAPYFAEARSAFLKLAALSLAKIPAFIIVTNVRSNNVSDGDISALLALCLCVIEIWLSASAISNLFLGLFHLGERSEARTLISEFPTSRITKHKSTPEALRAFAYVFVSLKCAGYTLPEMLLLSKAVLTGSTQKVFNPARLYPYALILSMLIVLVVGIVFASRSYKYIKAIAAEGQFTSAVDSLTSESMLSELETKLKIKNIRFALLLFTIASLFSIDARFDNLSGVNLVPRIFFIIILLWASKRLTLFTSQSALRPSTVITGIFAILASSLSWLFDALFLDKYSYADIAVIPAVRDKYIMVVILYFIEALAISLFLLLVTRLIVDFARNNTGISKDSDRYSRTDEKYHSILTRKIYIWFGFGVAMMTSKALDSLLKYFSDLKISGVVEDTSSYGSGVVGMITVTPIPFWGVVVFALSVLFIGYSMYLFKLLFDESEMKYI